MKKRDFKHIDEFTEESVQPLADLYERLNNQVIGVISKRLNKIGKMSASDVDRLVNLSRINDLDEIEKLLAQASGLAEKEIERIVKESAENNDELYDVLYKAKGKENLRLAGNKVLQSIATYSAKNMTEGVLNLTKTTAVIINGNRKTINKAYIDAVNFASYQVKSGTTDYYTAIRQTVANLSKSGLRTVDFESGYSRRVDSQVRMNVLDGVRQMNDEYRMQQGREFGADGVEISVHANTAPDHQQISGQQYSIEEFKRINNSLDRPIGTMGCHHFAFPIVLGVSQPVYSQQELSDMNKDANSKVTYDLANGKQKTITKYEATQIQRRLETDLRRNKEKKIQFDEVGDKLESQRLNKKIKEKQAYYKKVSGQIGLTYRPERARIYK